MSAGRAKVYDHAYFQTWYRDPKKAIVRRADLERKVAMALGAAEHLLGRTVDSVLDVGCGEGSWQPILRRLRPRLKYLGLDTSEYAIRRYGRSRNLRAGSWGQLSELRFGGPFDLVVCSDALHYVPTKELLRGLGGLPALVGGAAYLDFLTSDDDLETGLEGDLVGFRKRTAAWYRKKLRATGLVECGLGIWAAAELAPALTAMERGPKQPR
ncbi:MAG TPA: class I SAM-dependent methyltransferase [Thermoanaerobaculia bacterium]|nr:class I SAM-dependent methyltransferase [Thermoanaerobaculia bacterium]